MKRFRINRPLLVYILNLCLLASFLVQAITGILKYPGLPPALGLSYSTIDMVLVTVIHRWAGIALLVFVGLHILFHFRPLVFMTKKYILRK